MSEQTDQQSVSEVQYSILNHLPLDSFYAFKAMMHAFHLTMIVHSPGLPTVQFLTAYNCSMQKLDGGKYCSLQQLQQHNIHYQIQFFGEL